MADLIRVSGGNIAASGGHLLEENYVVLCDNLLKCV